MNRREYYKSATRVCEHCGKTITRADKPGVIYSAFMRLRYCGLPCSRLASRQDHRAYFYAHIDKRPGGCWQWTGRLNDKGYGVLYVDGSPRYAHRYSLEISQGPIGGQHALHSCDNPACVNPAHLRAGSHRDNMRDAKERNRFAPRKGERSPTAKLTEEQARYVLHSSETGAALARRFKVSRSTIYAIRCGTNWGHLNAAA